MLKLTDAQWERIRRHFPEERSKAGRRVAAPGSATTNSWPESVRRGLARRGSGWRGGGKTQVGKGMKIMAVADSGGLPLAVGVEPANRAECRPMQLKLDLAFCGEPPNLVGDKAYDSDPLDAELRERGVEMIAPHRRNRTRAKTQDGRRLRRYRRRWLVERLFAWLQWRRRLLVRWEYHVENFLSEQMAGRIKPPGHLLVL